MKGKVFAGAALAALMAAGAAHAQGHVGLSYQNTDFGSGSDLSTIGVDGSALLGSNFQVNGAYSSIEDGDGNAFSIDGFLFSRSDTSAVGGFLGYQTLDLGGSSSADNWSIGGFAQLYSGNTTWTGQLGYSDTEGDVSVIHVDGEARHFFSDNFSAQVNLGYGDVDASGSGTDFWSGGVGGEFQLTGAPISIYGGWQHIDVDGGDGDSLGVGIRWNFGGGTLLEQNRSGASFRRNTPNFFEAIIGGGNTSYMPR